MTIKHRAQTKPAKPINKIGKILALLSEEGAATLDDLCMATGWQKHIIRASLTGLRNKGHTVERKQVNNLSYYVLAPEAGQ